MKELLYVVVLLLVGGPLIRVNIQKINFLKLFKSEFAALWYHIHIEIIFHTL